jgi:hypothetical protein
MEPEPIHILALISRHQRPEFVNPRKRPFYHEALLVHLSVELSFAPTLDPLPIPFVLWNIGTDPPIPQHLSRFS